VHEADARGANPYLSLTVTYAVVTVVFAGAYLALPGPGTLRVAMGQLNWTALVLGLVVVFLDLAFLMMYRGGFRREPGTDHQPVRHRVAAVAHRRGVLLGEAQPHQHGRHRAVYRGTVAHQPKIGAG
jgi:hypothetical protein